MAKTLGPQKTKVTLTGYIAYPTKEMKQPPKSLLLRGVENLGHAELPRCGINLLYGYTKAVRDVSRYEKLYRGRSEQSFLHVNVETTLLVDSANSTSMDVIPNVDFVHFGRARRDVLDHVEDIYRARLEREGLSLKEIDALSWSRTTFISRRPDILEEVLADEKFKHLDLFAYPVQHNDNTESQRCTLMSARHITGARILGHKDISVKFSFPSRKG